MDSPTATTPGLVSGPCREKFWNELSDAEKIGRLHEVVKQMQRTLEATAKRAADAHCIATEHEHGGNGKVLMPPDAFNRGQCEQARKRDEKWF